MWANLWYQILVSTIFTTALIGLLFIIDNSSGLAYFPSDIITFVIPIAFWGCQGFYWGVATPLMTKTLLDGNKLHIKTDPIFPNRTPILLALSNMLTSFSAWLAILISLTVIALFMVKPQVSGNSFIYPFVMASVAYITCGAS